LDQLKLLICIHTYVPFPFPFQRIFNSHCAMLFAYSCWDPSVKGDDGKLIKLWDAHQHLKQIFHLCLTKMVFEWQMSILAVLSLIYLVLESHWSHWHSDTTNSWLDKYRVVVMKERSVFVTLSSPILFISLIVICFMFSKNGLVLINTVPRLSDPCNGFRNTMSVISLQWIQKYFYCNLHSCYYLQL
jgi:hypothetical protein